WAVELLSPYLHLSLFQLNLVIEPQLLLQHLAEYFGFLLLLCALLCWMTAVRLHRIKVQTGLRGGERKRGKHRMRNVMLGTQFFICWIFVSFTVALFLQAETTTNALFGTLTQREKAAIFSIPLDYTFWKHEQKLQMVNRIRTHAGVKEVLLSDVNYMQGVSGTGILTEKDNRDSYLEVNVMAVPANFFTFMHLPVVKGKPMANQNEMLVDEVFARKQKEAVMGRMLYNFSEGYTVCGVAETFIADVYNESPGFVFLPTHSEDYVGHCYVKAVAGQEHEVKAWIEKVQRQCLPESVTPRVSTLLNDIHEEQAVEYKMKSIILFFSIVSVIITLLGVYSAITLDTERRQKEVAIRKVNGAGVWRIIVLFARLYGWLLIVTAALSFPLVGVVLRLWKQGYTVFFQTGIGFYAGIFAAVTLVTAFTIFLRIVRTARMNPAESIKNE
ncbi:MAG: FtsX-like permease family protein, partial [Bacteroides sp.]